MFFKKKAANLTAVDYTDLSKSELYFAFSLVSSLVGRPDLKTAPKLILNTVLPVGSFLRSVRCPQ